MPIPCSVKSNPYEPTPPSHSCSTSFGSSTCNAAKPVISTSVNVPIVIQSQGTRMT